VSCSAGQAMPGWAPGAGSRALLLGFGQPTSLTPLQVAKGLHPRPPREISLLKVMYKVTCLSIRASMLISAVLGSLTFGQCTNHAVLTHR